MSNILLLGQVIKTNLNTIPQNLKFSLFMEKFDYYIKNTFDLFSNKLHL